MLTRKTLETLLIALQQAAIRIHESDDDHKRTHAEQSIALRASILDLCCGPETKEADNGTDPDGT